MGLLDANADALDASATNTIRRPSAPPEPGLFHNFAPGAGNYFMRSMAQAGRSLSMLGAAVPVAIDAVVDPESPVGRALELPNGTDAEADRKPLADRYFAKHDEIFNNAVDAWTPKPGEVGTAGQVLGQLSGGIVKFLANPPLSVADVQMSTGEDLVRQGVDANTAVLAGGIAGVGQAVGIRLPNAVGGTLFARVASGAAINTAQSVVTNKATQELLKADGAPDQVVQQFDPLNPKQLTIDGVMGAVFGAKAHWDVSQSTKDALMVMNQARHLETASLPGKPATPQDATAAVDGTKQAIGQLVRGEPVAVDQPMPKFVHNPETEAFRAEMVKLVDQVDAKPIELPEMKGPDLPEEPARTGSTGAAEPAKPALPKFDDSVMLPAGDFDPATGEPRMISATEAVVKAHADAATLKQSAPNLLQTVASCLLGSL